MNTLSETRLVQEFWSNKGYELHQDETAQRTLESIGKSDLPHDYLFVKTLDGEYIEIWGVDGIPFSGKNAYLLHSWHIQRVKDEISHTFQAVGELAKTKRYPKNAETFINRVYAWLECNKQDVLVRDVEKFSLICAYNFRWITAESLEYYGIDRESLWLER